MTRAFRPEGKVPGSVSSMMVLALSVMNAMRWPVSGICRGPPVTAFFDGLVGRAVSRQELAPRDGPRLATFVTMLLWGIIALAAADPASISRAVETAKWAAAGRLT